MTACTRMQAPSVEPQDFASFFEEGADVGMADEEELVAEDSSTLFTRGVREIVPWPVEILDLPDPTEPELLATGTSERHSAEGASNLSGPETPLSHPCVPRRRRAAQDGAGAAAAAAGSGANPQPRCVRRDALRACEHGARARRRSAVRVSL